MIAATLVNGLGASNGIFAGIKKLIYRVGGLGNFFGNIIAGLIEYIFFIIYMIFYAICQVILLSESLFLRLAGIDPLAEGVSGSTTVGGQKNLLLEIILNKTVINIFISMVVFAIVLMFIFTFIAIVKSEFTLDSKKAAKGPIFVRALKGLAMFIVVPITCIFGIYISQGVTQSVYSMFNNNRTSMYSIVFQTAAYDANRARNNSAFYEYLKGTTVKVDSDTYATLAVNDANRLCGEIKNNMTQDAVATAIDEAFRQEKPITSSWNQSGKSGWAEPGTADTHMYMFGYPKGGSSGGYYTSLNPLCVHYFYDMTMFNYLIGLVAGAILGWTLFGVSLALVKRMFNVGILFLISPAVICMYPLDDGQATKGWTKKMVGSVISIITAVFAFNVFFLLLPIIYSIKPFATGINSSVVSSSALGVLTPEKIGMGGFFNLIFQVIVICVGAGMIKNASKLVNGLLGVEDDLIGEGTAMAGKAVKGMAAVGGAAIMKAKGLKAGHDAKEEAKDAGKTKKEQREAAKEARSQYTKGGKSSLIRAAASQSEAGKAIYEAKDSLHEARTFDPDQKKKDAMKDENARITARQKAGVYAGGAGEGAGGGTGGAGGGAGGANVLPTPELPPEETSRHEAIAAAEATPGKFNAAMEAANKKKRHLPGRIVDRTRRALVGARDNVADGVSLGVEKIKQVGFRIGNFFRGSPDKNIDEYRTRTGKQTYAERRESVKTKRQERINSAQSEYYKAISGATGTGNNTYAEAIESEAIAKAKAIERQADIAKAKTLFGAARESFMKKRGLKYDDLA